MWSWAFGIVNTLMICFIFIRNAYTHAHLPVCSNLLSEPENYSVVSDYRSPVWQPHFSGTLKVTTVEQMAQFPQPFWNNKTLLQRNANLQMLECFLKQDRERRWKETFLSVFFRNKHKIICTGFIQFHTILSLHNSVIYFGVGQQVSMRNICTIWCSCHDAVQWS